MSKNIDWDIDYYKTDYESEEHWELRRLFMETHKDKFDEDELVCLAQVFTNIEFMGCKYPDETMRRVAVLSKEVAKDFRKKRAGKLKRTFVGAQDAAGAKVKGRRMIEENNIHLHLKKPVQFLPESTTINQSKSESHCSQLKSEKTSMPYQTLLPNKYRNFIIFVTLNEDTSAVILQNSASKQKISFEAKFSKNESTIECVTELHNIIVAKGTATNQKDAKTIACDATLVELQKECYTLKRRPSVKNIKIDTTACASNESKKTTSSLEQFTKNQLNESNKGFKMLKMLGWNGGALSAGGIETPIGIQLKVDRKGVGLTHDQPPNINRKYFAKYLSKYKNDSDNIHELVFSKDFTKEERAILHTLAGKQGLKSCSKNTKDGDRFLVISKKVPINILAKNVLNNGIYTEMYELIHPTGAG